jgi:heme-degrading monooxygenase HmoA
MAKLIVHHTVKEFTSWKAAFDSMHTVRQQFGCTKEEVFKGHVNPNDVVIITHWGSLDQAHKYGQSAELKAGMSKGGVVGQPDVYFLD